MSAVGEQQYFCFPAVVVACVSGWIYSEGVETLKEKKRERVISLGSCTTAARFRVGDILEPSIVYTDHKHLGSKAE